MPDPAAAQNLFDAFKAFVGSPTTHSLYSVAKDFQTLATGFLALLAAWVAYRGVMKRIEFDRKASEAERKVAILDRQRLKYGAFLRLQSQMRGLSIAASLKLQQLERSLKIAEGKTDEVEWVDDLVFGNYDELEKAWKKIDLFPLGAIFFIEALRSALARTKETEAHCLADRNQQGNIKLVDAKIYRDRCADVERRATHLIDSLEGPIREFAKIERPESKAEQ
jgi:hypothetical protein